MNILDRFTAAGVRFRLDGDKVVATMTVPITDEIRTALRESKDQIKAELEAIEDRRQRLLALLAERPGQKYAVIYDPDANDEYDVLMVAIPSHTFEVRVPKPADSLDFAIRMMKTMDRINLPTDLASEGQRA